MGNCSKNCCKNCRCADFYTGWEDFYCKAKCTWVRAEYYDCEDFVPYNDEEDKK